MSIYKSKKILIIVLLVCCLVVFLTIYLKAVPHDISGTYSAGNEPSEENIYLVFQENNYTIYNQLDLFEAGTFESLDLSSKADIYRLTSSDKAIRNVVYENKNIVLLNFQDADITLKKISMDAIYLKVD